MYSWFLRQLLRWAFARLEHGDLGPLMAMYAPDGRFVFPGRSPFAADARSKEEVRTWLMRFAHFRPHFEIHDVIAAGPPWDIRGSMHFTDRIGDPSEPDPYVNEGVCLFRVRWGRVVEDRVFLDTQAVAEFFGTESSEEFFDGVALSVDTTNRTTCPYRRRQEAVAAR